jgi:dipeptidyl aminopeptidase/acylaminoacyl peptidase
MHDAIELTEKYEYQGWPSLKRPDVKPPDGWSLPLITAVNRVRHHAISPDGQRLAFIWDKDDHSDIYTMPISGGWPARITFDRAPVAYWADKAPVWSPDSHWLAFTMKGHVYVVSPAGGLARKITDFARQATSVVWLPDSAGLVVGVERYTVDHLLLTDRHGAWPRALTSAPGDHWNAHPSPDGRWLVCEFRPADDLNRCDIYRIDVTAAQVTPLIGAPKIKNHTPRWSPAGRTIAFISERSGWNEIWLMNGDGRQPRQLTHQGQDISSITWSPDGGQLACTVNDGGVFQLALVDVPGGNILPLRQNLAGYHSRPCWSPDGTFLTVEYESPTQPPDLYRVIVPDGQSTQLTFSNPPALQSKSLVIPERVSYPSFDGLEIPALLYTPTRPNGAAILHPHGGPTDQYVFEWDIIAQYFVAKGYTFLCPNFRGSTGYGLEFEHANYNDWGGGDTQDNLYGAKFLHTLPWINPQRLAIYGGSYGGFMTACCLSRDPDYLFACGVAKYGDANLVSSWAQCNRDIRRYTEMQLGHPARNQQVYRDGSPIYQVDNVCAPVLIMHGLEDDVVPPEASEEWVAALRRAGKTFEYKTYPGEAHGFLKRETQLDVWQRVEQFLDWYLL